MIKLPVVGEHDALTKVFILETVRGAMNITACAGDNLTKELFGFILEVWPDNATYEIEDRWGHRYGSRWAAPIDLSDDVFLTPKEFLVMLKEMHKENHQLTVEDVGAFLERITNTEVFKLMKKLEQLNHV